MRAEVDGLMAALFPRACILCGLPSGRLNTCGGCRDDLQWIHRPCACCGAPLPEQYGGALCADCPPSGRPIDRTLCALAYQYPVDRLVTRAKFHARVDCAQALGELLGDYLRRARARGELSLPELIVPVPLHRRRLASRGFNQALEIAQPVARMLRRPALVNGCIRRRDTLEQTTLTGAARRKNVRGAFHVTAPVDGNSVAIVDDVWTTGSTAAALAVALREAGAAAIQVWTVARVVR